MSVLDQTTGVRAWTVGRIEEIPLGEGRAFVAGETPVAVFRLRDGSLHATQAACPHAGGPLADGQTDAGVLVCPLHLYAFRWRDGDGRLQRVELDADVDVDAWPEEAWSHQFRDVTLEDDASEAVATAVQEVLWSWGLNWPVCRDHLTACSPCSGVWACDGHDLADV